MIIVNLILLTLLLVVMGVFLSCLNDKYKGWCMNEDKVIMHKGDFWSMRVSHESLAVDSGNVRHMVLCAKERLDHIALKISRSDRPNQLCHIEDEEHMYVAMRLLTYARDEEARIRKEGK